MIWPHALTVYPSGLTTDTDGNPVRRPADVGVPAVGFVQPTSSSENTTDGQSAEARFVAFLDPGSPCLDAFSRLVWAGRTFETLGEALWFADPDDTVAYWRITLRTGGG